MVKKDLRKQSEDKYSLDKLYFIAVISIIFLFLTQFLDLTVSYAIYNTNQDFFLKNEINENIISDFQKWDNYFLILLYMWLMPLFALTFIIFVLAFRIETIYRIKHFIRVVFVLLLNFLNIMHIIGFISWLI